MFSFQVYSQVYESAFTVPGRTGRKEIKTDFKKHKMNFFSDSRKDVKKKIQREKNQGILRSILIIFKTEKVDKSFLNF